MVALRHGFRVGILATTIGACSLSGAVKLQILEGRPLVVGVYVNGHGPYRFLLDTGANVNLLDTSVARKIAMKTTYVRISSKSSIGKARMPGSDNKHNRPGRRVRADCQTFQYLRTSTRCISSRPTFRACWGSNFSPGSTT